MFKGEGKREGGVGEGGVERVFGAGVVVGVGVGQKYKAVSWNF